MARRGRFQRFREHSRARVPHDRDGVRRAAACARSSPFRRLLNVVHRSASAVPRAASGAQRSGSSSLRSCRSPPPARAGRPSRARASLRGASRTRRCRRCARRSARAGGPGEAAVARHHGRHEHVADAARCELERGAQVLHLDDRLDRHPASWARASSCSRVGSSAAWLASVRISGLRASSAVVTGGARDARARSCRAPRRAARAARRDPRRRPAARPGRPRAARRARRRRPPRS